MSQIPREVEERINNDAIKAKDEIDWFNFPEDMYAAGAKAEYLRSLQRPGPIWKMFSFEKPPKMVRVVCRNMNTGNITGYINAGEKQWHPSDEFEWLDESGSAANTESQDRYLPGGILAGPAGKILLHHLDRLYDGFNSSMLGDNEDRVRSFILGLQEDLKTLDECGSTGDIEQMDLRETRAAITKEARELRNKLNEKGYEATWYRQVLESIVQIDARNESHARRKIINEAKEILAKYHSTRGSAPAADTGQREKELVKAVVGFILDKPKEWPVGVGYSDYRDRLTEQFLQSQQP